VSAALTSDQRMVVEADRDQFLLACPGSGKTRTGVSRIARLMTAGARVAACSYTNVGVDRMATMLAADHHLYFEARHYNGTLHRLLLRYVVHPFAHILGAEKPIRLWLGDWPDIPFEGDHGRHYRLDQFRVLPDGKLKFYRPDRWAASKREEVLTKVETQVFARKRALFRGQGILSSDDAMWIALRILREHPRAAAALAGRFDELLIDEAQDTSDLQLACLREIRRSGRLVSLVMVGDLEQSIYAYQGATAKGCQELAVDSGLEMASLSENHRSSQKLCDVAANFSRRHADTAVGPNRECQIEPELFLYPPDDPQSTVTHYRDRLDAHGISYSEAAVLARSHAMRIKLGGQEDLVELKPKPRLVGELAAALAAGRLDRFHLGRAEGLIAWAAFDRNLAELEPEAGERVAAAARRFIGGLPRLDGDLRSWILDARAGLREVVASLADEPSHEAGRILVSSPKHKDVQAAEVFSPPAVELIPQTVHALKGEDREAVMVVLKKHHGNDRSNQLQLIHSVLDGEEGSEVDEEERRITYVALTRAERFCLLALPDDPKGRALATRCESIGFTIPQGTPPGGDIRSTALRPST
jgi:DNA helicase-2/ATP-dependent DNA helicase PcrA